MFGKTHTINPATTATTTNATSATYPLCGTGVQARRGRLSMYSNTVADPNGCVLKNNKCTEP
jgi:hypothetical protein